MAVLAHDEDVDVAAHGDSVAVAEELLGAPKERQRNPSCTQPNREREREVGPTPLERGDRQKSGFFGEFWDMGRDMS